MGCCYPTLIKIHFTDWQSDSLNGLNETFLEASLQVNMRLVKLALFSHDCYTGTVQYLSERLGKGRGIEQGHAYQILSNALSKCFYLQSLKNFKMVAGTF